MCKFISWKCIITFHRTFRNQNQSNVRCFMFLICLRTSACCWAAFLFLLGGVGPVLTTSMTSEMFFIFSPFKADATVFGRSFSGISKVFPGQCVSNSALRECNSCSQVASAAFSSYNRTISLLSSLNSVHIVSLGTGMGSTPASFSICSIALLFFCPTVGGSFILWLLKEVPLAL